MSSLLLGIPQKLFDAAASGTGNSLSYSLPARASQLTWQTSFGSNPASITLQLQTSLDGTIWNTIDSSTTVTGEIRTINSSAIFVRARINAISGGTLITVSVVGKQVTIGSSLLSTLSDVSISGPTDGQVLTFDGGSSLWKNADSSGSGGISFADLATPPTDTALGSVGNRFGSSHFSYVLAGEGPLAVNLTGDTYPLTVSSPLDYVNFVVSAVSDGYVGSEYDWAFTAAIGDEIPLASGGGAAVAGDVYQMATFVVELEDTTDSNSVDAAFTMTNGGHSMLFNGAGDVGLGPSGGDVNYTARPVDISTASNLFIDGTTGNTKARGTITATDFIPTDNYKSVDGSAGLSTTITTATLVGKTITIKNGIITGFA